MFNRSPLVATVLVLSVTGFATFVAARDAGPPASILATATHAEFRAVKSATPSSKVGVSDLLHATTLPMKAAAAHGSVAAAR